MAAWPSSRQNSGGRRQREERRLLFENIITKSFDQLIDDHGNFRNSPLGGQNANYVFNPALVGNHQAPATGNFNI